LVKLASPIPPNTKDVGYPWRDFMRKLTRKLMESGGQCRITIPKHFVLSLGWEAQDDIEFIMEHDRIIMKKANGGNSNK